MSVNLLNTTYGWIWSLSSLMCTTNLFHVKFNGDFIFQFWWFHQQLFTEVNTEVFKVQKSFYQHRLRIGCYRRWWCIDALMYHMTFLINFEFRFKRRGYIAPPTVYFCDLLEFKWELSCIKLDLVCERFYWKEVENSLLGIKRIEEVLFALAKVSLYDAKWKS